MAINDQLKKLYHTITGKTAEGMAIDEIVKELNDNYPQGGGGSDLPTVTSDDNGDVLTVVEGAWAKAEAPTELPSVSSDDNGDVLTVVEGAWGKAAPQSGSALMVTAELTTDAGGLVLTNVSKSVAEIVTAANGGLDVIVRVDAGDAYINFIVDGNPKQSSSTFAAFAVSFGTPSDHDSVTLYRLTGINEHNVDAFPIVPLITFPSFEQSDAGYVLKVNASGTGLEWAAP